MDTQKPCLILAIPRNGQKIQNQVPEENFKDDDFDCVTFDEVKRAAQIQNLEAFEFSDFGIKSCIERAIELGEN